MFGLKRGDRRVEQPVDQQLLPQLDSVSVESILKAAHLVRTLALETDRSQFDGLIPHGITGWDQALNSLHDAYGKVRQVRRAKEFDTVPGADALLQPLRHDIKSIRTVMSQRLARALVMKLSKDPRLLSVDSLLTHLPDFDAGLAGNWLGGKRFKPEILAGKSRKEIKELERNVIDALEAWAKKSDEYIGDGDFLNLPTNEAALQDALDLLASHAKRLSTEKQAVKRREQAAKRAVIRKEQKAIDDADAALAKQVADKIAAQKEHDRKVLERLRFYFAAGRAAAGLGLSDIVTVDQTVLAGAEPADQELVVLAPDSLSAADAKVVAALSLTGVKIHLLVREEMSAEAGQWMPKELSQDVHLLTDEHYTDSLPTEVVLTEPFAFGLGLAIGSSTFDNWTLVDSSAVDSVEPIGGAVCVLCADVLTVDVVRSCISVLAAGRTVTLVTSREISEGVQLWLDKAPDLSLTFLPEMSLAGHKSKEAGVRAQAQETGRAGSAEPHFALLSAWKESLAAIAKRGRIEVVNSSTSMPSATSSFAEHCPASSSDPLLWLTSQDDDWEQLNGKTQDYVIEMAQLVGTEIAITYGSEIGTYPPFVTCDGTSALGNTVVARITGCDEDGRLGIRVGVPVGYVTKPEALLDRGGAAQFTAGWLGFKMRQVTMQVLGVTDDQAFIQSKNVDGLTGALFTPGDMLDTSIVRPWFCISPSGVDESGRVIAMRGGVEAPIGHVSPDELVLCLYVGLELLVGIDPETDARLLSKIGEALSVGVDAVTLCDGLVEELGIVPFSCP